MNQDPVILFGAGFTAARLAVRLRRAARIVYAAARRPERFSQLRDAGVIVADFTPELFPTGAVLAHTIPPVEEPDQERLREFLMQVKPRRVVYVSATSVYGDLAEVDVASAAVPTTAAGLKRREDERWIEGGPWDSLILRAAAIYGPGRGAHRRLLEPGRAVAAPRRGPSGLVSRIHVDDLAALVEAGLDSKNKGTFPVADELPCPTVEILRWCASYLGSDPDEVDSGGVVSTGRKVDGRAVVAELGVRLEYPNYRTGIPACLLEESRLGSHQGWR